MPCLKRERERVRVRRTSIRAKFWGPPKALNFLRAYMEKNFDCILSPLKRSDQGGEHFFATIFVSFLSADGYVVEYPERDPEGGR